MADWWDQLAKPEIKQFCLSCSTQRGHRRKCSKKFLLACLKVAYLNKDWPEISRIKSSFNEMILSDIYGIVVRSRFCQNVEKESGSLFHAARELRHGNRNNLLKLKIGGHVVEDSETIENHILHFYHALFNGHHNTDLVDSGSPFLPDNSCLNEMLTGLTTMGKDDSEKLHQDVTYEEVDFIVNKKCADNKAPGIDGLSYEFYKATWPIIGQVFSSVLKCQLETCQLVKSNREGVTRLLPKVMGVPEVEELRPVTLLNCDCRILSKLIVSRMKPVLPMVIRSGQLCTVGRKNILFGVSNILSSVMFANQKKRKACLMSLDFFKAYDRVLLSFLVKVMQKMGFSSKFCAWIEMLHEGAKTRFLLRRITRAIELSFSIRQGDPLAMLLYIIYVEPLLMYIKNNISGLHMENLVQKEEAFCDDINVITSDDCDLLVVDEGVRKFESISGAIFSRNKKCSIIGFGSWKKRCSWPLAYLRSVKEIKIFGLFIENLYRSLVKKNWNHRFSKFEAVISSWSTRFLPSIYQRVNVLKIFALSRVFYIASVIPITRLAISKFEKLMGKFLWTSAGKVLRVSLADSKNRTLNGGLGLTCLHTMCKSLLLSQFLRLLKSDDEKTMTHIGFWMGDLLADLMPAASNLSSSLEEARTLSVGI